MNQPCDPSQLSCGKGLYCSKTTLTCQNQLDVGQPCNDFLPNVADPLIPFGSNFFVICKESKCMGNETSRICSRYRYFGDGSTCNFDEECKFGYQCDKILKVCKKIPTKYSICPGYPKNCSNVDEKCICTTSGGGGHDILQATGSCQKVIGLTECEKSSNETAVDFFKNVISIDS